MQQGDKASATFPSGRIYSRGGTDGDVKKLLDRWYTPSGDHLTSASLRVTGGCRELLCPP